MLRWISMFLISVLVSTLGLAVWMEARAGCPALPSSPVVQDIKEVVETEPVEDLTGGCTFPHMPNFSERVGAAANLHGVNPRLLALTVYRESGCNVQALGGVGEIGLTQVYPKVWVKRLIREGIITDEVELWNPDINLQAGAFILSLNAKRAKGDAWGTLRRYNGAGKKARTYASEQMASYREHWDEDPWVVEE